MSRLERAIFFQANRVIQPARDGAVRFSLPVPRRGRFAGCANASVAAPAAFDAERAAAVERSEVPRRYARAILF